MPDRPATVPEQLDPGNPGASPLSGTAAAQAFAAPAVQGPGNHLPEVLAQGPVSALRQRPGAGRRSAPVHQLRADHGSPPSPVAAAARARPAATGADGPWNPARGRPPQWTGDDPLVRGPGSDRARQPGPGEPGVPQPA